MYCFLFGFTSHEYLLHLFFSYFMGQIFSQFFIYVSFNIRWHILAAASLLTLVTQASTSTTFTAARGGQTTELPGAARYATIPLAFVLNNVSKLIIIGMWNESVHSASVLLQIKLWAFRSVYEVVSVDCKTGGGVETRLLLLLFFPDAVLLERIPPVNFLRAWYLITFSLPYIYFAGPLNWKNHIPASLNVGNRTADVNVAMNIHATLKVYTKC